jgi:amino acid transporter
VSEFSTQAHRPRNVNWERAAALLYGDWGTSKAYVIGLAFAAAGFASFPIIIAVCILTAVVGYNYAIVCRNFPDGGGVYSAAREQSRLLAAVGALLLIANFLVTAAISGWEAMRYLGVSPNVVPIATMVTIMGVGVVNYFGPKHSGSMSIVMAIPTVAVVVMLIALSLPHLSTANLERPASLGHAWVSFVGVILALSGVEAIANMTGVMKLDPGSTADAPHVRKTASRSIFIVAVEVILGTTLLGWAMLSVPKDLAPRLVEHRDDMLRFLGEHYGTLSFGHGPGMIIGIVVGVIFGVLLLSAVNTAIVAVIGVLYMMALDGEFPRPLTRLNRYGVPTIPLVLATMLPVVTVVVTGDVETLASLYAIGVVGAIAVNLGSCTVNRRLDMHWWERALMGLTFLILSAVWLTVAYTISHALFFAICVVGVGLSVRAYSHRLTGLSTITVSKEVADIVSPEVISRLRPRCEEGQKILVAARGATPVLRFALDFAAAKKATLYVLYVKEIAVFMAGAPRQTGRPKWQDDPQASAIMSLILKLGEEYGVPVLPVYVVSLDPAATILDLAATLGADYLMLGAQHRFTMAKLLKGNVVERVAAGLPEDIQLLIHG